MIGDREADRSTDIGAIWFGHGVDLAERMSALADDLLADGRASYSAIGERIREVLLAEYDPRPLRRPTLGDPPTLRPSTPPNSHPGRGLATEAGS